MKKVLVFRTDLLPHSETFIKEQILALTQWTPILAGYRRVKNGLDLAEIDVRIFPGLNKGRACRWWLRLSQWMGIAHAPTVRALRETEASLVHVHFGTDAVRIWPSVRKLGLPMLITLHGYDITIYREWWEAGKGGLLMRSYPRQLLRMAKNPAVRFVAVSQAIMARAVEYGIPPGKITVCYIGVDIKRFKPSGLPINQRPNRILFVGRMVEKKAPLMMMHAFEAVRRSVPNAQLVMIGDGPLLSKSKQLASELGTPVEFLGACNPDQVLDQLQCARVFCLPSVTAANGDSEGLPIAILEAQACGLPVVTSAPGGAGEVIIDGLNGFSFAPNDLNALCKALCDILCGKENYENFSEASVRLVNKNFSITSTTQQLEDESYNRMHNQLG